MAEPGSGASVWRHLWWQLLVTAIVTGLAVKLVDPRTVLEAMADADWRWVVPALLLFTLAKYVDSWRWRYLLGGVIEEDSIPQRGLFFAYLIGNMANNLLPLRVGDVAKIQVLGHRYGASRAAVAASVFVVEATLDGLVFAVFIGVALVFWDLGRALLPLRAAITVAGVALLAFAGVLLLGHEWPRVHRWLLRLPGKWGVRVAGATSDMLRGLTALRSPRRLVGAIAWSLPVWVIETMVFALFGRAFGLELALPTYLMVIVAANLATAVPVTVLGVGPYEAAIVAVLSAAGVDGVEALSYAVASHLSLVAWIQVTGLLAFWALGLRPAELLRLTVRERRSDSPVR